MLRLVLCFSVSVICLSSLSLAQGPDQRQYYGEWKKHATKPYFYRSYFFKKAAGDSKYTYQYGIYFPSRDKKVYMYNPDAKVYWGVWVGDKYSVLPKEKQKASIDDIGFEDFLKPGLPPSIPGSEDKVPMIAPPNDFPKGG
jgi:hypothetical protein